MKTNIIYYKKHLLLLAMVVAILAAFTPKEVKAQGMPSYIWDIENIEQTEEFNQGTPGRIELLVTIHDDWRGYLFDCFDCYFTIRSDRYGPLSILNSQYLGNRKGLVTVQYYESPDSDIRYDTWNIYCMQTNDSRQLQIKQVGGDPSSFIPGTIKCYKENVDYGTLPGPMQSLTPANGGCGDITYQWELNEGSRWEPIAGATSLTHQPTRPNATTSYRRAANSCSGAKVAYSNEITIAVPPSPCITAINVSKTVIEPSSSTSIYFSATLGSGVGCASDFSTAFLNIYSATYGEMMLTPYYGASINYPQNTSYSDINDLLTAKDERSGFQTTFNITIKADFSTFLESVIAGDQIIAVGNTADSILLILPGSNKCGTSLAKWQKSIDNGQSWQDIAGADGTSSYYPGAIAQTTRYRHYTYCEEVSVGGYSNEVMVVAKSLSSTPGFSPSLDKNYIVSYTPQKPHQNISGKPILELAPQIVYYDGLGRPTQDIQVHANSWYEDIVTPITYDPLGRKDRDYLPYSVFQGNAGFQPTSTTNQSAWYAAHHPGDELFAYSRRRYEESPLNRVVEEFLPGAGEYARQGEATAKATYGTNGTNEVRMYTLEGAKNGYYATGTLYKETATSPDSRVAIRYTDLQGRVVEERQVAVDRYEALATSYVYDSHGLLRLVIPPLAQDMYASEERNRLMYHYTYDSRGRCIVKRLPDSDPTYMVYDRADRMVMSQDGNQRVRGEWTRYFYDRLNREVATAYVYDIRQPDTIQLHFSSIVEHTDYQSSQPYGYALAGVAEGQVLTYTYYDYYNRVPTNEAGLSQSYIDQYGHPIGQLTGQAI